MKALTRRRAALGLAAGLLACGAFMLGGCKGKQAATATIDQLEITRYRYVIDEKRGVGRVLAEVHNTGQAPVREVEARGYLRSRGGENRGESIVTLKDIKPDEKRAFSIEIVSHGKVQDAVIELQAPGTQRPVEGTKSAPAGAEKAPSPLQGK